MPFVVAAFFYTPISCIDQWLIQYIIGQNMTMQVYKQNSIRENEQFV